MGQLTSRDPIFSPHHFHITLAIHSNLRATTKAVDFGTTKIFFHIFRVSFNALSNKFEHPPHKIQVSLPIQKPLTDEKEMQNLYFITVVYSKAPPSVQPPPRHVKNAIFVPQGFVRHTQKKSSWPDKWQTSRWHSPMVNIWRVVLGNGSTSPTRHIPSKKFSNYFRPFFSAHAFSDEPLVEANALRRLHTAFLRRKKKRVMA